VGVSSLGSITDANAANATVTMLIPIIQPMRNPILVARARGVNRKRIAGMMGNGDAAIARASGTTSPIAPPTQPSRSVDGYGCSRSLRNPGQAFSR